MHSSFDKIASAIGFMWENRKDLPSAEKTAEYTGMEPCAFRHIFHEWSGTSVEQFMQYLRTDYIRNILQQTRLQLSGNRSDTFPAYTSATHNTLVSIEGMTPAEYGNGGKNLQINFSCKTSPFGEIFIASTHKGVCCLEFTDSTEKSLKAFSALFPNASLHRTTDTLQQSPLVQFPPVVPNHQSLFYLRSSLFLSLLNPIFPLSFPTCHCHCCWFRRKLTKLGRGIGLQDTKRPLPTAVTLLL